MIGFERRALLIQLTIFTIVSQASLAFSQPFPPALPPEQDDVFYKEVQRDVSANLNSVANPALLPFGGAEFIFGDVSPGEQDEDMRCVGGQRCAESLYGTEYQQLDPKSVAVRGAEVKHRFNTYSAPRAVVGTLNSVPHQDMINTALASVVATTLSSIELVEPAIARGLEASLQFSNETVALEYDSDNNFQARIAANPGMGELIRETRNDCIGNMLADNPGMVWTEAKTMCDGDTDTASAAITRPNFQPGSGPEPDDGPGLVLGENLSHANQNSGGAIPSVGTNPEEFISLWGYLLRQDAENNPGMEAGVGGVVSNPISGQQIAATLEQQVNNLRRLVGDVLFRLASEDSGVPLPNPVSESTKISSVTVLPPHLPINGPMGPPQALNPDTPLTLAGPQWYIKQYEAAVYDRIWELMRDYCNYVNTQPDNPYEYTRVDQSGSNPDREFWKRPSTIAQMRDISSPNVTMTEPLGELLFYFIALEDAELLNADAANGGSFVGYNCSRIDPAVNTSLNLNTLYSNALTGLEIDFLSLRNTVVKTLANRIATDTVWAMLGKILERLERISGGVVSGNMKEMARTLVERVSRSDYMGKSGPSENYQRTQALIDLLSRLRASDSSADLLGVLVSMKKDSGSAGMRMAGGNNAN